MKRLAFFDLDHTLLDGDSDVLWCDFLIMRGLIDAAAFAARNVEMEARYQAGTVGLQEFADFYVSTLTGRSPEEWEPVRQDFLTSCVAPRIGAAARALVRGRQDAGDLVVLTTATNRYITTLTAGHLGIEHLIAIEPEIDNGRFTGRTTGTINMREGKVKRLYAWLHERGTRLEDFESSAYSDSINDLPLLSAVQHAVVVDPDARLAREAARRNWRVINLRPPRV